MNDLKFSLPLQNAKDEGRRFHELDSMRGLAAIIVLFHHFIHMFYPALLTGTGLVSVLIYPLIGGHESVMFFFLLSGFVLSLPFLRGKSQSYSVFVRRRILRIYGPYLGALVLAVAGCALWHNRLGTAGWAAGTWSAPVSAGTVIQHVLFLGDYGYNRYNTAFWSLVYEMRISIIFPLLFAVADKLRTKYALLAITACTVLGVHAGEHKLLVTFEYIGIFLAGILLAKNLDVLNRWYRQLVTVQRASLAFAAFLLYNCGHRIAGIGPLWHFGDMPVVAGAAGFIVIGLNSISAHHALNSLIPAFLGRISYSLYLMHGTVLFAMAAMLKDKVSHPVFFLLYLPTAILLSWGFYLAVEKPFMVISRKVGRRPALSIVEPVMRTAGS
jgi:peptidoglycan/LPS O-acetylase OafA/YrhL